MDPDTKVAITAMRRILRGVEDEARTLMALTGLTHSQLVFLELIGAQGELKVSDLARLLNISTATVTVMVKKLEARALLLRRPGLDRRQSWLKLSPAGEAALVAAPDGLQTLFAENFGKLAAEKRLQVTESLTLVADLLQAKPDAAAVLDAKSLI